MAGQLKVNGVTLATEYASVITLENPQIKDSSNNLVLDQSGSKAVLKNVEVVNDSSLMFRNLLYNGDMQIAQRGTSVSSASSSGYKALDRYRHTISIGTWTISQSTDAPDGFGYSMKMDCTTAEASPSSTDALSFVQKIEGLNLQNLNKGTSSAKSVTLSFWVKCTKTGTAQVNLIDEDNNRMIGQQFTINATNTWEQKILTFAGDTTAALDNDNGSSLRVEIWLDAGSSYKSGATPTSWEALSTTDYFAGCDLNLGDSTSNDIYITGVQLEIGSSATPFEHRPYGMELGLCQRYYAIVSSSARGSTGSWLGMHFTFPVTMRAAPSIPLSNYSNGSTNNISSVDAFYGSTIYGVGLSLNPSVTADAFNFGATAAASAEL